MRQSPVYSLGQPPKMLKAFLLTNSRPCAASDEQVMTFETLLQNCCTRVSSVEVTLGRMLSTHWSRQFLESHTKRVLRHTFPYNTHHFTNNYYTPTAPSSGETHRLRGCVPLLLPNSDLPRKHIIYIHQGPPIDALTAHATFEHLQDALSARGNPF